MADLLPADEELVNDVVNNFNEFELNIMLDCDGFNSGFSVPMVIDGGSAFIGVFDPEVWGEDWPFEEIMIDIINETHVACLACKFDGCSFIEQTIHRFELQFVEVNKPVKQIDTDAGLWCDRMDGGERVEIGIDEQYIYGLVNNRLSSIGIAEEGTF